MDKVKEKIEIWKCQAEVFIKNNTKAYLRDLSDNYYFCEIIKYDDDYLYVKNFIGKKQGVEEKILFCRIIKFDEYEGKNE